MPLPRTSSWCTEWSHRTLRVSALILLLASVPAHAHLVRGHVRDAESGEPLSSATLQIVRTYRGTVANREGAFLLNVTRLPARIRVTYIGYASQESVITDTTRHTLEFHLEPVPYGMAETVVRPDEANRIMARVIRRKAEWLPRIQRYRAQAYSRLVLENATDIVIMGEVVSEVFWDMEKGRREVVLSRRVTENVEEDEMDYTSALEGFTNLYDDDIAFLEHSLVGVTHPDALRHYDFQLIGRRRVDDDVVFDIRVEPKNRLQMALQGRVAVLDGEFALLEAELAPNRAALASALPIPLIEKLEASFGQQFRRFEGDVWLPVDYKLTGLFDIGMIGLQLPVIKFSISTRLTEYEVNALLPDSVYASEEALRVDSSAVAADTAFTRFSDPVPLTPREQQAYATIDESFTPEEAFRPTGFLTRFMDLDEDEGEDKGDRDADGQRTVTVSAGMGSDGDGDVQVSVQGAASEGGEESAEESRSIKRLLSSLRWHPDYNRVSEAHLAIEARKDLGAGMRASAAVGYSTGQERWTWDGALRRARGDDPPWTTELSIQRQIEPVWASATYPRVLNAAHAGLGLDDYYDYYWSERMEFSAARQWSWHRFRVRALLRHDEGESLRPATCRDLLRRRRLTRPNAALREGTLRELELLLSLGSDYTRFGAIPNRRLEVKLLHGGEWLGGDGTFTRGRIAVDTHIKTFWRRRWVPNALDLRLAAGGSLGDLPVQRLLAVDVAMGPLSPFGALRSLHGRPLIGDRYAAVFWEHNFKTTPFEFLGLWPLVQRGFGLVVHGASARTWMDDDLRSAFTVPPRLSHGAHHELGVSLLAYHLLRVDFTRRLDADDWRVGVGIARFDFE